ncbi:MAG: WbqC family protein [Candidatus Aenigmarchaeota archaeon]|nr:WbqC family protein [Candidatus Aenigmarchaeota archaeon]
MTEVIVSIHQPNYLPYLGFFDKIKQSDVFVLLDNVQFLRADTKHGFYHRNRIRTPQGWMWLTLPIKREFKVNIHQAKLADDKWKEKHWKAIKFNYENSPFWSKYSPFLQDYYQKEHKILSQATIPVIKWMAEQLGIKCKILIASEMDLDESLHATDRLIEIIKKLGGTTYIAGKLGKDYMEVDKFPQNGIKLVFQDYKHPEYKQNFSGFVPYLSAIDYLFNTGGTL